MAKSTVYFTSELTPEAVVKMYRQLGIELPGKVAVKVHSGEKGNQNFLRPEFWCPMVEEVHCTIVECNTAYGDAAGGVRDHTESHRKLLQEHGWTKYFDVDLMDAEGPDVVWPIPNGKVLKENHVGKHILHYDSMLVLAHFKGHPMGGYGGALKQLAIGCASRAGKALIHSAGKTDDRFKTWEQRASSVNVRHHQRILHHFRIVNPLQNAMLQNAQVSGSHRDITFRVFQLAGGWLSLPAHVAIDLSSRRRGF